MSEFLKAFDQSLRGITKGSPLILTGIALILLSNPSLAMILILDYLVIDPTIRYLIHAINPNFHLPGNHVTMHMILLTYVLFEYLKSTSYNIKPSVTGFASQISDNKIKLILLLVLVLTIITIAKSDRSRLEIAVAAGIGIIIGLFTI